jgi:hypothetical protein
MQSRRQRDNDRPAASPSCGLAAKELENGHRHLDVLYIDLPTLTAVDHTQARTTRSASHPDACQPALRPNRPAALRANAKNAGRSP